MITIALLPERPSKLPVVIYMKGNDYIRNFMKRNNSKIHLGRPAKEFKESWRAWNVQILTTLFSSFEKIILNHAIDASSIYNLD